ncbi:MAG: hypothetical protein ACTSR8_19400 [Promethearchaeota archaeon]
MESSPLEKSQDVIDNPKYLYLDQNAWIGLGRVHYGKEINDDLSRVLSKIIDLVEKNKLIVPINLTNVLEMRKIGNKDRRERLAKFMILLSKGYCFMPYVFVETMEMINLMQDYLNFPLIDIKKRAFGVGFFYLCSDGSLPLPYRNLIESLNPSEEQKLFIQNEIKRKITKPEYLLNYMISDKDLGSYDPSLTARMLEFIREEEFKNFKDKDFRNRYRLARSLLDVAVPKLARICYDYGINPRELYPENPSKKQLMDFFKKLPTIYTNINLINELMKNKDYSISSNDLHDINSFSFAVPYCDYVVGEKHFISVAKQKKLDELYDTILIKKGNFEHIESFLDAI